MAKFADRLRELRKCKGITQRVIAQFLDITDQSYQKYEYGTREPNHATIIKLADFFNAPIDYLLGRIDNLVAIAITERIKILLSDNRLSLEAKGLYMQLYNIEVSGMVALPCEETFLQESCISKTDFDNIINQLVDFGYIEVGDSSSAKSLVKTYIFI